ncbi:MAG: periplasmic heavy metal sensor [Xanthomonadales bacterium]|nr:periplasmic heavy metal sensor [Xanthomonadales bacterium]
MRFPLPRFAFTLILLAASVGPALAAPANPPPLPQQALQELAALSLTPAQKLELMAIFLDARAGSEQLRTAQQDLAAQALTEMQAQQADLHALIAAQESLTDQRVAALRAVRDDLLGFYDDLSSSQQAEVQTWLARQLQRLLDLRTAIELIRD